MKKLTAEEFARKVMENDPEIEWDEYNKAPMIYAHISEDGDLVRSCGEAEWTISTIARQITADDLERIYNGELEEEEKQIIIEDLYPQYIAIIDENF